MQLEERGYKRHKCALHPVWFWLTVVNTLRYTGMRQNQLLHIRICDVNFDENWINLRTEGSKNHKEHRIPIVTPLIAQLELLVNRSLEKKAEIDELLFDIGRFIPEKERVRRKKNLPKKILSENKLLNDNFDNGPLRAFFRRLSKECHFPVSPHRFRHTIATQMMKSPDRNLQIVKTLLGHSSLNSTLEYLDGSVDSIRYVLEEEISRMDQDIRCFLAK